MNKKIIMKRFIEIINDMGLMTKFINIIFDYHNLNDYNYIFRMLEKDNEIIIDIYDNISSNKFNRYIFSFNDCNYVVKELKDRFLYIKYISVLNIDDNDDKLFKFAYLFKIGDSKMLEYANSFLDSELIDILSGIIK